MIKKGGKIEFYEFLFKWGVCSMGMAPRGHEWTVESTRAGPRDARRLMSVSGKIDKKGEEKVIKGVSL